MGARGKQVSAPEGVWYTAVTGIWQTVWLEPVPQTRIQTICCMPDVDRGAVRVTVTGFGPRTGARVSVKVAVLDGGSVVAEEVFTTTTQSEHEFGDSIRMQIRSPKLWSPDSPFLYDLRLTMLIDDQPVDRVASYFGIRKTEREDTKQQSLRIARQLFGAHLCPLAKHDGRADALLIARYGQRTMT